MISQSCPRCSSKRIRRGYRPTPLWWRIIGRYNLLCNHCNWEFIGFALPGTVKAPSGKRRKTGSSGKRNGLGPNEPEIDEAAETFIEPDEISGEVGKNDEFETGAPILETKGRRVKIKRRVRLKLNK